MQRIAKSVPKPCYALEFDLTNSMCQACEFQHACFKDMGARRDCTNLSRVAFKLVPKEYGLSDIDMGEDPEIPQLENLYMICHQTVFGRKPKDKVAPYRDAIIAMFRQTSASMRLFMLANMVAQQQWEMTVAAKLNRSARNGFYAKLLTTPKAITRLDEYRDMCRKSFGSFDIGSLSLLTDGEYEKNDIDRKMLHSEITAARKVIGFKISNAGQPYQHLYHWEELTLDPHWLATEPSYEETVLKPHRAGNKGTTTVNNHRHSVAQVLREMKRRRDWSIAVFQARERAMQPALSAVLHTWGFMPNDFEIDKESLLEIQANPMKLWVWLGRAIQHVFCLRYALGEDAKLRV